MNSPTPTSNELAAAREIVDSLWNQFKFVSSTIHGDIASIITKHRSEEVKELQRKANQLLKALRHRHINNGKDDSCKHCGFDLRHEIHATMKGQQ